MANSLATSSDAPSDHTVGAEQTSPSRNRFIGAKEAARRYDFSLPHFRRLYRTGKVPAPVRVGARKVAWMEGVIDDDIAAHSHKAAA